MRGLPFTPGREPARNDFTNRASTNCRRFGFASPEPWMPDLVHDYGATTAFVGLLPAKQTFKRRMIHIVDHKLQHHGVAGLDGCKHFGQSWHRKKSQRAFHDNPRALLFSFD